MEQIKTDSELAKEKGLKYCKDNNFNLFQTELFLEVKNDRSYKEIGNSKDFRLTEKQAGKQAELMFLKINNRLPIGEQEVHSMFAVYKKAGTFNF
jgi:hypothetical protein